MSNREAQYRLTKDELYFLYRFMILPWELKWKDSKFLTAEGNLKTFEKNKKILLKCCQNIEELEQEAKSYPKDYYEYAGVILFNRTDNKPKSVLRHLRNLCAHGDFRLQSVNKRRCVGFKHYSDKDKRIRAIGHIPFDELKPLLQALATTRVCK